MKKLPVLRVVFACTGIDDLPLPAMLLLKRKPESAHHLERPLLSLDTGAFHY